MENLKKWIEDVISQKSRLAIPIMTHPGIELIGKTVRETVTSGEVHYQAIKALNDTYPAAACTVIMDLTVEAEAFGAEVNFPEDDIPTVIGRLVSDEESVKNLQVPDIAAARVPEYLLANKLASENIKDKPVFSGMIGPYSLAGRLYDMSEFMMACYCEPEVAEMLLEKCTEFLIKYCKALKATGADGVVLAEPAAGLMSNDGCSEFSSKYIKEIVDAVQDDTFIVILHNCGNGGHCTSATVESGAAAYHFGNKIDMVEALKGCPADSLVMGNLDPVTVLQQASPEEVRNATMELLKATAEYLNFIISTGCDVPPHTSHDNIKAFYSAIEEYNK
jgi:uroporphyrinogen decarboxylase